MNRVWSNSLYIRVGNGFNEACQYTELRDYQVELKKVPSLRPTEEHYSQAAVDLADKIEREGVWTVPILIEINSNAILDGHHRFSAANQLQLGRIPVVAIKYDDPRLDFTMWDEARTVTKSDVLEAAKTGDVLPPKTTRHLLSPPLPVISIDIAELRRL